jgi:hypothetical protein
LLITLNPLRGPSIGVQPPTDAEKSDKVKLSNIKPIFSELVRQYDLDRRTVKKYYDGYEGKPKHHNKSSKLDEYYDIIKHKLSLRGVNVRAVYEYLIDEVDAGIGTYSNFNKYVNAKGLKPKKDPKRSSTL